MSSSRQVLRRTLDYLGLKYPWIGAVLRSPRIATLVVLTYLGVVGSFMAMVYGNEDHGLTELVKSYSPLFFDVLVIFLGTVLFLVVRGYYLEEGSRLAPGVVPDPAFFRPLWGKVVALELDHEAFQRHPAIAAVLDALPMDQSDYFLAHAGALDIPKLCLRHVAVEGDTLKLTLRAGSFREFFFTHHFADFSLSRSRSKDSGEQESLRKLLAPGYARSYAKFFRDGGALELETLTPNTLGVTGLVCLQHGTDRLYVLQHRGWHESAARRLAQLSYAGTLNAYPWLLGREAPGDLTLDALAADEFEDEVLRTPLGDWLQRQVAPGAIRHELAGLCTNTQYLFQPELFVLTTVTLRDPTALAQARALFGRNTGSGRWLVPDLHAVLEDAHTGRLVLRPLCRVALETIFLPHLHREATPAPLRELAEA